VGDRELLALMNHVTGRFVASRADAVKGVPEWEELREAARAIKDEALAHLDRYLVQLEESVTRAAPCIGRPRRNRRAAT
jgi:L-lactate dehydrogenase complex protein LldF